MALWSNDDKVIATGATAVLWLVVYQVFYGARTVLSGALRGAGDTFWLAVWSAVGTIGVLGLGGYTLVKIWPQAGSLGPWTAAALSVMTVATANYIRFKSNKWKQIDLFKRREVAVAVENEATLD
jgi:Na+-driven multidrug efflux pump